jgi:hypothetical protein
MGNAPSKVGKILTSPLATIPTVPCSHLLSYAQALELCSPSPCERPCLATTALTDIDSTEELRTEHAAT